MPTDNEDDDTPVDGGGNSDAGATPPASDEGWSDRPSLLLSIPSAALTVAALALIEGVTLDNFWRWMLFAAGVSGLIAAGLLFILRHRPEDAEDRAHPPGTRIERWHIPLAVILVAVGITVFVAGTTTATASADGITRFPPGVYYGLGLVLVVVGLGVQSYSPTGPDLIQNLLHRVLGVNGSEALIIVGFLVTIVSTLQLFDFGPEGTDSLSFTWTSLVVFGALLTMAGMMRESDDEDAEVLPDPAVVRARSAVRRARAAVDVATRAADGAAETLAAAAPPPPPKRSTATRPHRWTGRRPASPTEEEREAAARRARALSRDLSRAALREAADQAAHEAVRAASEAERALTEAIAAAEAAERVAAAARAARHRAAADDTGDDGTNGEP